MPLLAEPQRQLAGQRGLARSLEAEQHDHGRRVLGQAYPPRLATQDGDELLVDDLDDLLGRVEGLRDLSPERPLLDRRHEAADHGQGDVGLEQRDADLTAGLVDVGLGQPSLAPQVLERGCEPVGESGEHGCDQPRRTGSGGPGKRIRRAGRAT